MQALITEDLALIIEVYKVRLKYGDPEPVRCFGVTKSCSHVKTLEGWTSINISGSYLLSSVMVGQSIPFTKLRIFAENRKVRVSEKFSDLAPDHVKVKASSAMLTQTMDISGSFLFEKDYKKVRRISSKRPIEVDLHRVLERGILSKNK